MLTLVKSDYVKLVPILALAFYMAFIPHQNYPYPVHIDEWVHLAFSKALLRAHDTTFIDPFLGQVTITLSSNLERGFQLFWGVFHQISGLSWLTIIRFFPGIVFMMTVLSTYVLARRQGFGWEAALFTCLIPTTVGIMGPAFFIPVAMGLLFVPLVHPGEYIPGHGGSRRYRYAPRGAQWLHRPPPCWLLSVNRCLYV